MSMHMNNVVLIGHIGVDPEVRNTSNGNAIMTLKVVTNDRVKKGEEWVDDPQWHSVVIFGRQAENAAKYLSKGDLVAVYGSIKYRKWQDKEGNQRYSTEILANSSNGVLYLKTKRSGERESGGSGGARNEGTTYAPESSFEDGDVPF